ncbi:MAG: hypothetical protein JNK79_19530 [Chitinophagaceae bacterium]|nr:hypothetical protein [Chitinophagaceae bacterium]
MPGRGDKNTHGSAGRGARNQSNEPFVGDGQNEPASDHNKNRNRTETYHLRVDEVPYVVETFAFMFNDEKRFNVRVNGGPESVFAWDPEMNRLRPLDDDATILPDALEETISKRILSGPKRP